MAVTESHRLCGSRSSKITRAGNMLDKTLYQTLSIFSFHNNLCIYSKL